VLVSPTGLVLRPIEPTDLAFVQRLRNDVTIERLASPSPPWPHPLAEFADNLADPAVRLAASDGRPGSMELLCVVDGEPAGIGGLYGIDWFARHAELGVSLAEGPWRGRGLGELAHRMLAEYAFDDLNLRRVLGSVHADNERVLGLCRKLGFVEEGRRREHRWVAGRYVDLVLLSMDRTEYRRSAGGAA